MTTSTSPSHTRSEASSDHSRGHHHSHDYSHSSPRRLIIVLVLTAFFMAAEFAAALITGSLALLADAGHMLRDVFGLMVAAGAAWLAQRPEDESATFGYKRFEALGAFVNSLLLLAMLVYIFVDAIQRFANPVAVPWQPMLLIGVLGLIINIVGIVILSPVHSDNINMRGAYLEVMADALGSVAVIAAAIVIWKTGWVYADAVLALGISVWIGPRTWMLLRDAARILLEMTPEDVDITELEQQIMAHPHVVGMHDLHVWALSDHRYLLSVHLETHSLSDAEHRRIIADVQALADAQRITRCTIQIEPVNAVPEPALREPFDV